MLAQNETPPNSETKMESDLFRKHSIYVEGCYAVFLGSGSLNYDYTFKQNMWNKGINMYAGIGGGYLFHFDLEVPFFRAKYGLYIGRGKHHFDVAVGISLIFDPDKKGEIIFEPALLYGNPFYAGLFYRYQKPGGNFMFKAGASFPEGITLGIGCSFGKR